ncbi:efflux RND transporter periplasmic adaptor subunit [Thiomicrorhabdus indica]|uniref:efflux RND transporter periplasmic adaptor subunit n=1 Tax=Thiomicrorhabdus indica TaxID=2267253 RepID=UPI00102DB71B|nr:efflux RND transporter periplasmic adaptor subunit [Thiomicrorhabdus indica]
MTAFNSIQTSLNIKQSIAIAIIALYVVMLSACNQTGNETNKSETTLAKPVKLFEVLPAGNSQTYYFPAKIEAYRKVNLSFEVDGKIETLHLPEGQNFKKGDLLASLKQEPFERRLQQSKLNLKEANLELKRIQAVDNKGYASKQDVTRAETARDLAQVDYDVSQDNLDNSHLYAPFDGKVAKRLLEENTYISRGTAIAEILDTSKVYFAFDVSERLINQLRSEDIIKAIAILKNEQQSQFEVSYAENEAQTHPITQTYRIYFSMPYPKNTTINLGSHASIAITLSNSSDNQQYKIPLSAIVTDAQNQSFVWVYQADTHTAERRSVELSFIENNQIAVLSGLNSGDQIVSAGASNIRSGQKLKPFTGDLQ